MKCTVVARTTCRLCGSDQLTSFLTLPDMPLTDQLLRKEELGTEFLWPIGVYVCDQCGLAQTLHDLSASSYYHDYQYSASWSPFARRFMQRLALETWQTCRLQPGDTVIDIGCSDGELLFHLKTLGAQVFGFEPSEVLAHAARSRGIPVSSRLFDHSTVQAIPVELLPAQVVVSTYTFDHLPDPLGFLHAVRKILDQERGVLIMEVHDLEKIVERREYCLFAHEHTAYYTMATLGMMLQQAGFVTIDGPLIPEAERRGNSLLVVATPHGSMFAPRQNTPSPTPLPCASDSCLDFGRAVQGSIRRLRLHVEQERRRGRRLAGYGAGGRGVLTLAAIASPGSFAYICDTNPHLHGYYTPKSHIQIVSPDHVFEDPVKEMIVFSFGYIKEISEMLACYVAKGGQLVSLLDLL